MKLLSAPAGRRAGFSLVEAVFATLILVLVLGGLTAAMQSMQGLARSTDDRSTLQTRGQQALLSIVRELRRSGSVVVDGIGYPLVFDDGDPGDEHPEHAHFPAQKSGAEDDEDAGPDREILFLLPRDEDGDGRPDVDVDGELIWDLAMRGYVLVTGPDGVNRLELRVEGEPPRVLARHVERIVFDDASSSGFEIPLGSVRVRLFLRKQDAGGHVHRFFTEAVVTLRNG